MQISYITTRTWESYKIYSRFVELPPAAVLDHKSNPKIHHVKVPVQCDLGADIYHVEVGAQIATGAEFCYVKLGVSFRTGADINTKKVTAHSKSGAYIEKKHLGADIRTVRVGTQIKSVADIYAVEVCT